MHRAASVLLMMLLGACAVEPAVSPSTQTVAAITTTTTASASATAPTPTLTTTLPPSTTETAPPTTATIPNCELGDALDAVWMVETDSGHGTAFHIGAGEWITAAHVVGDAKEVTLSNGADIDAAMVVGADYDTDVAILQSVKRSQALEWSSDAAVGDTVIAAGFPLYGESSASVTRGVVSRRERDIFLGELVLTDTAVNPGNSGGPLLTECGDVVGMIVEKIVDVDVEGVGYAIAADELVSQLPRLRDGYRTPTTSAATTTSSAVDDPSMWSIFWSEPDLMTGETFPVATTQAVDWEMDSFVYDPPQLWIGCSGTWAIWWGGKYLYAPPPPADMPHLDNLIAAEWRIDDHETGVHSWTLIGDESIEAGEWTSDDLHTAANQPSTMWLVIRAWNGYVQDDEVIGTAMFALDRYRQTREDLAVAC